MGGWCVKGAQIVEIVVGPGLVFAEYAQCNCGAFCWVDCGDWLIFCASWFSVAGGSELD
jgi:hypothetical protein